MANKNIITNILEHDVSWYVESRAVKELDESTIDHIISCIKDGCTQGEIVMSYGRHNYQETTGWWHVINWRDIALELRNSIDKNEGTPNQKKARKRFDDEWTY